LFGGLSVSNAVLNDTWLFEAGHWTELCSGNSTAPSCPSSPAAVIGPAMVFDPRYSELVLFGGDTYGNGGRGGWENTTWIFHEGNWANVTSSVTPPGTGGFSAPQMAYDAANGSILLFDKGETWNFSNGNWTMLNPSTSPSARSSAALFFDADLGGTIMWGGTLGSNDETTAQTWEYREGDWTELFPVTSPPAGDPQGSTFDSAFGYGIVFGPTATDNSTWTYTGGSWVNSTDDFGPNSPPISDFEETAPLAYDSTDGYTVELTVEVAVNETTEELYATANQTWILHDPLTLNSTASSSARDVGENLTYSVSVTGGIRPYQINISSLPSGCVAPSDINNATTFTCRLTQTGPVDARVNVTDTLGASVEVLLPLTVYPTLTTTATVSWNPATIGVQDGLLGIPAGGDPPVSGGWTITDGTVGRGLLLNHTFSAAGTYAANFTAKDATGAVVSVSETIVVNPELVISANANASVTDVGLPVEFNATVTGGTQPLTYSWNFGDGHTSASNGTTHTYATAGMYAPHVWVNDSAGAGTSTGLSIRVNPGLVVGATANRTSVVVGGSVELTAGVTGGTAPYTYWWEFGDGGINRSATTNHTYGGAGNHTATLVVNDSVGGRRTVEVTVGVTEPVKNSTVPPTSQAGGFPWTTVLLVGGLSILIAVVAIVVAIRSRNPPSG
jgi:PKD repeat protein